MIEESPQQPERPRQPQPRRRSTLIIVALALVLVAAIFASAVVLRSHRERIGPANTPQPPAAVAPAPTTPELASATKPGAKKKQPLPELVPGSPLTDDRFAQVSADIVIAATGLKQDDQWEANVLAYMQKALGKEGLTVDEYTVYAKALYAQPDRARAVGENIVTRVEKKTGVRMSMDKMPLFKLDQKTLKQMESKLK